MIDWTFPYNSRRSPLLAGNIVTTSQPLAAQAGVRMMLAGGNAVDAALAAAIALTVVEPTGNGIGSDAFALVWDGRTLHGLNGSGRSPAAWTPERFARFREMPRYGWDAVTVPGAVSAWAELSDRFGSLPFEKLCEPAISYARHGFGVTPIIAERWSAAAEIYADFNEFGRVFLPGGRPPAAGEIFRCEDLARTLEEISRTRGEAFYRGELARCIARSAAAEGGALSFEDLAGQRAQWVEPLVTGYHGHELYELPPNGQGVAALIALGILEHFDLRRYPVDSADSVHLQVEAMKLAFADTVRHLADSEAMHIDCRDLLAPDYLKKRAAGIDPARARFPETGIGPGGGTVYLATADERGMMVSFIQSNFQGFGSGVVVPGTGISLHNRGYGFTLEEGHPNRVAGGKRPFQTIIPAFVTRQGRPLMCFGVMGAHMQAQGHVQMVVRLLDHRQNPQAASDAPRWHVLPDSGLALEPGFTPEVVEELSRRGHTVHCTEPEQLFGGAQIIQRYGGRYLAGSDHRKDGQAVGF